MNNRINKRLANPKKIISVYFTAGYPEKESTLDVIKALDQSGVDMIEVGLPYSDPLADGPTIQQSSMQALKNGMSTAVLFEQLKDLRQHTDVPVIVMGYFNAMLQYGVENFCEHCHRCGIDGIIMPDLPVDIYTEDYEDLFNTYELSFISLITPQTSEQRIKQIDKASNSFIYMVSSASTTGSQSGFGPEELDYFKRIDAMNLKHKRLVGFGIKDALSFNQAAEYSSGCIIGSAYIKHISQHGVNKTSDFIQSLKAQ